MDYNSPQKIGLTEYLASLKRTNDGLLYVKAKNLRSQQIVVTQIVRYPPIVIIHRSLLIINPDHFAEDRKLGT